MNAIRAIWKDGQVQLRGQANWPDGTHLRIEPQTADELESIGELDFMTEDEQGDDPESIARWIARFNALPSPPPPDPVEEAEWNAWLEKVKAYELEAMRREFLRGQP